MAVSDRVRLSRNCISVFDHVLGVQLVHIASNAASMDDADNGLIFMQEMIDLMKTGNSMGHFSSPDSPFIAQQSLHLIPLVSPPTAFAVGTAQFGRQLHGTIGVSTRDW